MHSHDGRHVVATNVYAKLYHYFELLVKNIDYEFNYYFYTNITIPNIFLKGMVPHRGREVETLCTVPCDFCLYSIMAVLDYNYTPNFRDVTEPGVMDFASIPCGQSE